MGGSAATSGHAEGIDRMTNRTVKWQPKRFIASLLFPWRLAADGSEAIVLAWFNLSDDRVPRYDALRGNEVVVSATLV